MTRAELNRFFRKALVGVTATPLVLLPGCGRSLLYREDLVIPSRDGGPGDAGPDAGFDGGHDAGFDAGVDGGTDGGHPLQPQMTCFENPDAGGRYTFAECQVLCASVLFGNQLTSCTPSGDVLLCSVFCGVGRLASGVSAVSEGTGLGRVLADMAAHEAAAVIAFAQLARELEAHGLHRSFQRGALRAGWEEQQHVAQVGTLAIQHGGRFAVLREADVPLRSVEELAFDNAVEGCVRETFGSLLGAYQARHAVHPGVRRVMAQVSADEVGHGAWSWELARQLEQRLPLVKRRLAREARDEAMQTLTRGVLASVPREQHAMLGLPDEERVETLAVSMRELLH